MIDVSELMTDPDFAKTFTVKRPTVVIAADGTASTTYVTTDNVVGIVQPAAPEDIQDLPEGSRSNGVVSVWSATEIKGSASAGSEESDVLVVDGRSYRVVKSEPRGDNGYYRVFAQGFTP